MSKKPSLCSVYFLVALGLLILNDFYLKQTFHNSLTGKISDFCGLYAFSFFITQLFPKQKLNVHVTVAIFFVYWKSPFSSDLISTISNNIYPIYRVIDFSDLMALIVLPFSYFSDSRQFQSKLSTQLISIISLIAFCSTTLPQPYQEFKTPQYLLLKKNVFNLNTEYEQDIKVVELDSVILIRVYRVPIDKEGELDDCFFENLILKDLDLRVLYLKDLFRDSDKTYLSYSSYRDSVIVKGYQSVELDSLDGKEVLNFYNGRLNGKFEKYVSNILVTNGYYQSGFPDSVWTFYDKNSNIEKTRLYQKGEIVKETKYESGIVVLDVNIDSRVDHIRTKKFVLAFIVIIIIGLIIFLVKSFKSDFYFDFGKYSWWKKLVTSIVSPIFVFLLSLLMSYVIPQSFTYPFLGIFFEIILCFMFGIPLFIFIYFIISIRKEVDFLLYILLFSFSIILLKETLYLKRILKETTEGLSKQECIK